MLVIGSMSIQTLYLHQSHIYVSTQAWSVPLYNRLTRIPVNKEQHNIDKNKNTANTTMHIGSYKGDLKK